MTKLKKILTSNIDETPYILFLIIILCLVTYVQFFLIQPDNIVDHRMWANQAKYFETHNDEQFNALWAYGHPGGPLIIGTIGLKHLLVTNYDSALTLCLIILDTLLILCLIHVIKKLRPKTFWWLWSLPLLLFHHSYTYNTPPSILATLITPLHFFYTLFLYQQKKIEIKHTILFGILCGVAVATRTDIGGILSVIFGLILVCKFSMRQIFITIGVAFLFFALLDPFMWFMPIQHIKDLIYKMTYHYKDFGFVHFGIKQFLMIASLACISAVLGLGIMFKKNVTFPLPKMPIYVLFVTTIMLFTLFLTSDYKAARYFFPLILTWEIMFFLFTDAWTEYFKQKYGLLHIWRYIYILYIAIICLGFI